MLLSSEVLVFIAQRVERDGLDMDQLEDVADSVEEAISTIQTNRHKKKEAIEFLREYATDLESNDKV